VVTAVLALDGTSLTCAQVAAAARGQVRLGVAEPGRARARAAAQAAILVAGRQPVYGRTTGVGANRELPVAADDAAGHGLRLLRSHAGGGGPLLAAEFGLATLVIRANQIVAGGSGVDPGVLDPLVDCVNRGLCAPIPTYGAIGTGDLTALAMTALCLLGEREWQPPVDRPPRFALASADALAFISSSAATLGEAALACHDLRELLQAAMPVAALAHLAVAASTEPYAAPVHDARPHPGQQAVAGVMRRLLAGDAAAARIQDPYGYRAFPQVHGPAVDAARQAEQTITIDLNAAAENPLIDVAGPAAWHNGNFHTAYIGLALDAARASLFQAAALSAARLGTLVEPAFTGLAPFQATDPPPSSGIMMLEYVSQAAIADLRRLAAPAALGSAVLSRGVEEHAGFSTQSARTTTDVVRAYRIVLACELVAAVRALRLSGLRPGAAPLAEAFDQAADVLPADTADRPLDDDLAIGERLLPRLAALAGPA
jgi:histidine ammonia-lyase